MMTAEERVSALHARMIGLRRRREKQRITALSAINAVLCVCLLALVSCFGGMHPGSTAALMLGCEGATVGTRFFLSEEAPALRAGKEMVAEGLDETGTTLVLRRFQNTTRVLNNGLAVKVKEMELGGATIQELAPYISGRRLKTAFETGNLEDGILTIGQINGILHDIKPVQEIMDDMMEECLRCLNRFR